jgi:microcystin-dependent protein
MAERISVSKGFDDDAFDTYVPELEEAADIRNALELFYYGNSEDGNATGDVSLHATIVDFDSRIETAQDSLDSHLDPDATNIHNIGNGNLVVGTGTVQTLTNKTLTTPKINENVNLTATSTELNVLDGITASTAELNIMDGITASTTEINYVDGVTSSIQTQIDTNTPTGMISIHSGSAAPTGWLLCDGTSYGSASYTTLFNVIGYTFGGSGANFNVPNLKGKVVVGIDASQTQFDTRGETGGAMTHQHTIAASSAIGSSNHDGHGHSVNNHSHGNNVSESGAGDHSHNTNQINNTGNSGNHGHGDTFAIGGSTGTGVATGTAKYAAPNGHTHSISGAVSGGGDHDHAITPTNISSNSGNHSHSVGVGTNAATGVTAITDGSHSHTTTIPQHTSDSLSNLQPYIALNYIIKI